MLKPRDLLTEIADLQEQVNINRRSSRATYNQTGTAITVPQSIVHSFTGSGDINGWQMAGWWNSGGTIYNKRAFIFAFVPANFIVTSATLVTKAMARYLTGWTNPPDGYYTIQQAKLYNMTNVNDAALDFPYASEYGILYGAASVSDISTAAWGGFWSPAANATVQIKSADVKQYLTVGQGVVFAVDSGTSTDNTTNKNACAMNFELTVVGYKS